MFSQEELEIQAGDKRKLINIRQRRVEDTVPLKELSRLVAKRAGFQYKQTEEILLMTMEVMKEQLLNKKQIILPTIGTITPMLKRARWGTNFNRWTTRIATKHLINPMFELKFFANKTIMAELKATEVTHEEVENQFKR